MGNRYKKEIIKKGQKFNNWTIVKEVKGVYGRRFLCINSDKIKKEVNLCHLKSGKSKGHYGKGENNPNRKHGMTKTRIWVIWQGMKRRCLSPNEPAYKYYGGRGIKVCNKWLNFIGFYEDMKTGYTEKMTIERINVNGNYCKENCKWIPQSEQARNTRKNIYIKYNNKKQLLKDWSKELNINYFTLYGRLFTYNLPTEIAFQKINLAGKTNKKRNNF